MSESQPQGCLAAILGMFGIHLGAARSEAAEELPYRLRDDFLSAAELSFYRVLQLAVKDQAAIATKVNLADIFFVPRPHEHRAYRNKIDRKHVDFLLCDPITMRPRCGIELDDSSHARSSRQERDAFVDAAFQAAGLPLIRYAASSAYNAMAIAADLAPYVARGISDSPRPAAAADMRIETPVCPKCNVPMLQRAATKGQHAGRRFWGCPNYPKCRDTG